MRLFFVSHKHMGLSRQLQATQVPSGDSDRDVSFGMWANRMIGRWEEAARGTRHIGQWAWGQIGVTTGQDCIEPRSDTVPNSSRR